MAVPSPGIYWVPSMFKPIMLKKGLMSVFSCVVLSLIFPSSCFLLSWSAVSFLQLNILSEG